MTSTAVVPFDQLNIMAHSFAKSGMFGAKTPDQALSLLLLAQAEGVHPAIAMRDFDIINGRPAKKAEAMHRSFIAAGGKITWHQLDDTCADATFSHPQGGTARITWDMARAQKAGLKNKDMYSKYPRQMLKARVVSEGCRTIYPSATSGLYVPEEAAAMEPVKERNMGAAQVVPAGDDEDITLKIPDALPQAAAPDASPAPQESPPTSLKYAAPLPDAAAPAVAAFITDEQAATLRDLLTSCDKIAEETFLKIAKVSKLEELPAGDYDEGIEWVARRKKRFSAK